MNSRTIITLGVAGIYAVSLWPVSPTLPGCESLAPACFKNLAPPGGIERDELDHGAEVVMAAMGASGYSIAVAGAQYHDHRMINTATGGDYSATTIRDPAYADHAPAADVSPVASIRSKYL